VQPSFDAVQIPQLSLQQIIPAAHRAAPQAGPLWPGTQVP